MKMLFFFIILLKCFNTFLMYHEIVPQKNSFIVSRSPEKNSQKVSDFRFENHINNAEA